MRERHFPRVCRYCHAPVARQEDTCWRCGAGWASDDVPRTTLRLIAGGASTNVAVAPHRPIAVAAIARAATEAHPDTDRWMNEGGSFASEADAVLRAATGRR